MKKNDEFGRSMVEMVGVLALMSLVTAGSFVLITGGLKTQKINSVEEDVANIASNIRAFFMKGDAPDYSELPAPERSSAMREGTQLLKDLSLATTTPFGGATTYSITRDSSNTQNGFVVLLTGLSSQDCQTLAGLAWNDAVGGSCNAGNSLAVIFRG